MPAGPSVFVFSRVPGGDKSRLHPDVRHYVFAADTCVSQQSGFGRGVLKYPAGWMRAGAVDSGLLQQPNWLSEPVMRAQMRPFPLASYRWQFIQRSCALMHECWKKEPQEWKLANLVFISKLKLSFENLRPTPLTLCVGKLAGHVVQTRLSEHMEGNEL